MASTITASASGITETNDSSGILNITATSSVLINGASIGFNPYSEGANQYGCLMSSVPRDSAYAPFSSLGPYTTYYNYQSDATSILQAWHMATGDGYPDGTTQYDYSGADTSFTHRRITWGTNNRLGVMGKQQGYYFNDTNYEGITFNLLPVRNTTSTDITRTVYWGFSGCWSTGYDGSSVAQYTPNTSTYNSATGGTWTNLYTYQTSSPYANTSFSVTFPANTTTILMGKATWYYYTTYQFYDSNCWYNVPSVLDGASLICDLRMLQTLAYGKFGGSYYGNNAYLAYNLCGSLYGNR